MENTRRHFLTQAAVTAGALSLPRGVLGANDRVRIGIIGPGARGQEVLKVFLKQGVEVAAMADAWTGRADEVKKLAPGVQVFDDHRKMLELKNLDAVVVATPLHCHARHFVDTLAAGKDLYSEKTMTWSLAEADACRKAALAHPKQVVTIGLQNQSSAALAQTKKWVGDGLLGKVTMVESWMSRNSPHGQGQWVRKIPDGCTAANVKWDAFLNGRNKRAFDPQKFINWRLYWEFSGGNITENMVHQIAWIMEGLSLPLPIAATMAGGVWSEKDGREVPDNIAVTLEFPETVVTWQSTFNNKQFGMGQRLMGQDGSIERLMGVDDMVGGRMTSLGGLHYYPEKTNRKDGIKLDGPPDDDVGALHVANFLACLKSRKEPAAPVEIGYKSAVAAHLANIAYRRKQRVTLEDARKTALHGIGGEGGRFELAIR